MTAFLDAVVTGGLALVVLALAMAFVRLWRGPSLPDRVVALDMMTMAMVAFGGLAAIRFDTPQVLDVSLVLALVAFLATVALARFAERNVAGEDNND
ncbi:monovalent cation/H+ antiporter complex subunit F [Salipiger marinus]|jgi:multicomponent Na+:H+ antiporter subunit F|uniref:Multisubunit sodium/proton antiporter, MrpF subunit (TC 2.A.63.1) n=1 Tax=Salipiger marinus TaxID=555512 RepID=A0A1G8SN49_9RHOB|nr:MULTISPECIES: monovalent cation/H+ antiporter complex subunit F [Salipiger]MEB3420698.1 monovalent cation/H+ antiporter complex subunit F [Salipiger manganoxidans]SDJ30604.1 multisubunit sodium/proton antiporter, MrpF subunit (TC 2.A.63.1) [Salipiger marinus]HBM57847.1 pH regulation protein F [Citreicella sp.]HBT02070.1 pH regulation protein F [Citreicella sp.]|tara:strand:- start:296 stop:586 length:291 start_codon:yes stop_codon:yes gene_type:complete